MQHTRGSPGVLANYGDFVLHTAHTAMTSGNLITGHKLIVIQTIVAVQEEKASLYIYFEVRNRTSSSQSQL